MILFRLPLSRPSRRPRASFCLRALRPRLPHPVHHQPWHASIWLAGCCSLATAATPQAAGTADQPPSGASSPATMVTALPSPAASPSGL